MLKLRVNCRVSAFHFRRNRLSCTHLVRARGIQGTEAQYSTDSTPFFSFLVWFLPKTYVLASALASSTRQWPCFLLQRALPVADEPGDAPVGQGGDASGKMFTLCTSHFIGEPLKGYYVDGFRKTLK